MISERDNLFGLSSCIDCSILRYEGFLVSQGREIEGSEDIGESKPLQALDEGDM